MTIHLYCARTMLDSLMAKPDGGQVIHQYNLGLRNGRWPADYVDSIGQISLRHADTWPLEQVAMFAEIHAMIGCGNVAMVEVETGGPPSADKEREANAGAAAGLSPPFTCSVDMSQNNDGRDGVVTWTEPIRVTLATGLIERHPDGSVGPVALHSVVPAGHAPLEIGSTHPSRTWLHLREEGAVARWPYGYPWFRLFLNLDRPAWVEWREQVAESLSEPAVLPLG